MARYFCIRTHTGGGKYWKKGELYEFASAPTLSDNFALFEGEIYSPRGPGIRTDLDGTYYFGGTGWDDLLFPLIGRRIDSAAGNLAYDYTEMGVNFAANSTADDDNSLMFIAQLPHAWKEGSEVRCHLHWKQAQDEAVAWGVKYRIYNNGDLVPSTWVTETLDDMEFTYVSGTLAQITSGVSIDMTGLTASSFAEIKLHRIGADDSYTGDALATEFDVHYQIDSIGSGREFNK